MAGFRGVSGFCSLSLFFFFSPSLFSHSHSDHTAKPFESDFLSNSFRHAIKTLVPVGALRSVRASRTSLPCSFPFSVLGTQCCSSKMRHRRLPLAVAPFIFLLVLASLYLGRDSLSWFPSSQKQPVPYKQLTQQVVGDGKRKDQPPPSKYR